MRFEEGVEILYGTNTFIFDQKGDWDIFSRKAWLYIHLIESLDFVIRMILGAGSGPVSQISQSRCFCGPLQHLRRPKNIRFFIAKRNKGNQFNFEDLFRHLKAFMDAPKPLSPRIEIIVEQVAENRIVEAYAQLALESLDMQDRVEITLKPELECTE